MTGYQALALARCVLTLVLAALFLVLAAGWLSPRRLRVLALSMLAIGLLAYPNFGVLHLNQYRHVHYWDAFHYFMGAKYLPELGYGRLYEATVVAGREMGAFRDVFQIRDLASYEMRATRTIDADAIRRPFTPARWSAFKRDLTFFGAHIREWPGPLLDHGYNDPPPRGRLLHVILRWVPATPLTLRVLIALDYLLMAAALAAVWRAFGEIPAALAFTFLSLSFFARFDYIGGSILRWDWIAMLLIGVAAFARGSGRVAGLCFGYAALARLFPLLFLVPLAVKWLQGRWRGQPDATLTRCLATATALMLAVGAVLTLAGEPFSSLSDYVIKIGVHQQNPAVNAVGLGSLIIFNSAPWTVNLDGTVSVSQYAAFAARPAAWVTPLAAALYLLVALPLIARSRALASMMYAVPLIFFALSPTGYYYSFLMLLVLLPWEHGQVSRISLLQMALLSILMAISYVFEFASPDVLPLFNVAAIQTGLFFLMWLAFEYARLGLAGAPMISVASTLTPPAEPAAG